MDSEKIIEIINNYKDKSNKDLLETLEILNKEFELTKEIIVSFTKHLDKIEESYYLIENEIKKRNIK
jgi:hypothetical protein